MSTSKDGSHSDLVELVTRLMTGQFGMSEEVDQILSTFAAQVPHPNPIGLIYNWEEEFDVEPTAEEVVERALAHRPIEL